MPTNIGPKIGIDGEADFRKEIASINQNLKTLGAEMDKTTSAFIGNEKSVEALTAQNEVLSGRMQTLADKADIQKKRLEDLDKAGVDPTSKQYQKLLGELYSTEAQMNKTEAEIASNTAAMDNLGKETEKTSKETSVFADVLKANLASEAIKKGVSAVAGAIGDITKAALDLPLKAVEAFGGALLDTGKAIASQTKDTAAYADEILTLSTTTGLSTDRLQEYKYMAELTDVSLDTITGSLTRLTQNMDKARDGNDTASAAFEALGVSVTNADGTLRDNEAVFKDAIAALGQMEDGTERDAAAMAIFGKSAKDLNPLIEAGADGIAEFALEAHDAGAVLDGDTLSALGKVDDAFQRFGGTMDAVKNQIGAQFAEPVADIMDGLTAILQGDVDEGIDKILEGVDKATEIVDELIPVAVELVETLLQTLIDRLPELIATGAELLVSIINGIAQALPQLIPVVVDVILTLTNTLLQEDNLKLIIEAGIELIIQLAIGLAEAFPELVNAILGAIDVLVDTLWEHKDDLMDAGKDLINGLWEGIKSTFNWLWEKISGFADDVKQKVKDAFGIASPSKVFRDEIGKNLALGIGEGFESTMGQVERDMMAALPTPSVGGIEIGAAGMTAYGAAGGIVEEITIPVEVGGVELARVLYRHIVGEGQRIGAASIA